MKPIIRSTISFIITAIILGLFLFIYDFYFGKNIGFYVFALLSVVLAWTVVNNIIFSLLFPMDIKILSVNKLSDDYYEVSYSYGKERVLTNDFYVTINKVELINENSLKAFLINSTKSRFQPLYKRLSQKSLSFATNTLYSKKHLDLPLNRVLVTCYF